MSAIIPSIFHSPIISIKEPFDNINTISIRWLDHLRSLSKEEAEIKNNQICKLKDENDK